MNAVVLDGNLAALRANELALQQGNDIWASCAPRAIAELREWLFDPTPRNEHNTLPSLLDTLAIFNEDPLHYITEAGEMPAYLKACAANSTLDAELGRIVRKAMGLAAEHYIESEVGERWIARRVTEMHHEHQED